MLSHFRCTDGMEIPVPDCIKSGGCRLNDRCQTIPYLHLAADEREWTGEGSTTQLLNGTMYSFLRIAKSYAIDPDEMAFAIHGTKVHTNLETKAKALGLPSEISTTDDGRNAIDLLHYENGELQLIDEKTWGSFKVAKAMGITQTGKKPDPSGEVYKTNSKYGNKGDPKMVAVFSMNLAKQDNVDTELQLNRYRILLHDQGIDASKMTVHTTVRDGGLRAARDRGVIRNTYMIPIKRLDDDHVREYFDIKQEQLVQAIETGQWSEPCNMHESWDGNRCRDYCPVSRHCPKGMIMGGN